LICHIGRWTLPAAALVLCLAAAESSAAYNRFSESDIDLDVFNIDQLKFLGTRIDGGYAVRDENGNLLTIGDFFGKPMILVLSYFKCDGLCSLANIDLKELIEKVGRRRIGKDYSVLTLSFDKYDNAQTLEMFARELNLTGETADGWTLATMNDPEDIKKLTQSVGFKYFWSPRDRTFFHPNIYIFVSPQGRVVRYLYANSVDSTDIELALIEAQQGQVKPTEVINLLVSYCYSYNFKEGRYTYNIPLFIAVGSLTIGVASFIVAAAVFKRKLKKARKAKEVV
jgi:protein SCO1/2